MQRIVETWTRLRRVASRLARSEDGPTSTEYAVMLAVIIVAAVAGLETFGDGVQGLYVAIEGALTLA